MGADSIKVLYDFTKCDQEGQKVSWKNLYANPFDGKQCIFDWDHWDLTLLGRMSDFHVDSPLKHGDSMLVSTFGIRSRIKQSTFLTLRFKS